MNVRSPLAGPKCAYERLEPTPRLLNSAAVLRANGTWKVPMVLPWWVADRPSNYHQRLSNQSLRLRKVRSLLWISRLKRLSAGPPTERHFSHTGMAHRFGRSSATLGRPAALSADSRGHSCFRMLTRRLNDQEPRSWSAATRRRRGGYRAGRWAATAKLLRRCARAAGLLGRCRSRPTSGPSESSRGTRRPLSSQRVLERHASQ